MFADLTSANTVGYLGKTLEKGKYNFLSLNFNTVDGSGLVPGEDIQFENLVSGKTYSSAVDHLEVYDPTDESYVLLFYSTALKSWADNKLKTFSKLYPDGFEAGTMVWYYSVGEDAPVVTQSGAVLGTDDSTAEIVVGNYNFLANPYPVEWDPNDAERVDLSNVVSGKTYSSSVDHIETYDPTDESYGIFFYSSALKCWCNNKLKKFDTVSDPIQPGDGVWFYSVDREDETVFDITFNSPIAK